MGNEQNAVVQPLLTGLSLLILFFLVKSQSAILDSNHLTFFFMIPNLSIRYHLRIFQQLPHQTLG